MSSDFIKRVAEFGVMMAQLTVLGSYGLSAQGIGWGSLEGGTT